MPRFGFYIIMACAFGACNGEDEDDTHKCVCNPVMKLEWAPTKSFCNNATFDWLLQTVLTEVSKQNDSLQQRENEMEQLRETINQRDAVIDRMEQERISLDQQMEDLISSQRETRDHNIKMTDELDQIHEYKAKVDPHPRDCADVQRYGYHYSGIYTVYPRNYNKGIEVFCDLNTDGGGWTVLQRRQDGSQNFDRNWEDYKWGFGTLAKEFWLGNDKMHHLMNQRTYELRVDLTDYPGNTYYAKYDFIGVDTEENLYMLHLGGYEGTAGDALSQHNGAPFSTMDADHDRSRSGNCAELYGGGGWWWVRCYDANLNGIYSNRHLYETIVWYQLHKNHEPMRHVEMKIRPVGFNVERY